MPSLTSLRIFSFSDASARIVAGPVDEQVQACLDVEGLEHANLLLDAEVRREAGQVGELSRCPGSAEELDHARRSAALHEVLEDGAVLARERELLLAGLGLGDGLGLHPEGPADIRLAAAEARAVLAANDGHLGAVGELPGLLDGSRRCPWT